MPNNDPSIRLATHTWDVDGTIDQFEIQFSGGYIKQDDVFAFSVVIDADTGLGSDRVDHQVAFLSEADGKATIKVLGLPAEDRRLVVYRSTEKAKLIVRFLQDSVLTKKNLDLNSKQMLFNIQEIVDGLNEANVLVNDQISTVIDLNKIIKEIYEDVLELLAAGGIVSVAPRVWSGKWEGDTETDEEFPMVGADVSGAGFYDVYVNGLGLEPDVDYEVILGDTIADTFIRFKTVPAVGSEWFAVLRGYAKPYTGPTPITVVSIRLKVIESAGPAYIAGQETDRALVLCREPTATTVRIQPIPVVGNAEEKIGPGSQMSFTQKGGPVTITGEPGVIIEVADGCKAVTRARNSTITATCEDGDANIWLITGDLAKED